MHIIPTIEPTAKRDGDHVVIDVQQGVSVRLTPNEALRIANKATSAARAIMDEARSTEPVDAQVLAFPVHATRRAAQ